MSAQEQTDPADSSSATPPTAENSETETVESSSVSPAADVTATLDVEEEHKSEEQGELGAGGMADTRDPDELDHEDPRKSISAAPTFEEYLKMRQSS